MQIRPRHTKDTVSLRKTPNHVVLTFTEGESAAESCGNTDRSDPDSFPKNIIEMAGQSGVRFLTFCCLGSHDVNGESKTGSDLKRLFHLLMVDHNWLLQGGIAVRFLNESKALNMSKKSQMNVSVISQFDGRGAIIGAVKKLAEKIERQEIVANDITSKMIGEQIEPIDLPDPDLLIFTGGMKRLENGLIWQSAYSEFAFVDQHWENLTAEHFQRIVEDYMGRDRRFGGLTKQAHTNAKAG